MTTPQWQPTAGAAPVPATRPWYRKKRVLIPAGLVLLAGIGGALGDPDETTPAAAPAASSPAATTSTSSSAPTEVTASAPASASSAPASSPVDTSTAAPAETATTAPDPYSERFGSFAPIAEAGTGDSVIQLPAEADAALITATHKGSANFVLQTLDGSNQMSELLVNEIGAYSGTVSYGLMGDESGMLQITADGAWTVQIAPITAAPLAAGPLKGSGDAVYKYEGPAAVAAITHTGTANFVVHQSDGTWPNLLINEIGPYEGSVPLMAGPSLLLITADGAWTVAAS